MLANFKNIKQNFDKRDKSRKARLKNILDLEKESLKNLLREYNRAAFYAPFKQEESVRMYDSINQARVNYQKMNIKISDNIIQQKIEEFIKLIQDTLVDVRNKYPIIHEYSQKINIPTDNELLKDKILDNKQKNDVVNILYNLRNKLNPLLIDIENYYNVLP